MVSFFHLIPGVPKSIGIRKIVLCSILRISFIIDKAFSNSDIKIKIVEIR